MENTILTELLNAFQMDVAAGRYSAAEQVCWRALEICGYRGPCEKFTYWLTAGRLKPATNGLGGPLWRWACFLADTYYELGKYEEAEPVYATLVLTYLSSGSTRERSPIQPALPDLLRKLAGAEAFIGKERRASQHWKLAERLSGAYGSASQARRAPLKGVGTNLVPRGSDRKKVPTLMVSRQRNPRSFSPWKPTLSQRWRFRRSR